MKTRVAVIKKTGKRNINPIIEKLMSKSRFIIGRFYITGTNEGLPIHLTVGNKISTTHEL